MKDNQTLIWVIIAVIALLFFRGFGIMGWGRYGGMMSMMYGTYGTGMMAFGWIYGILILAALVLFIVWLVRQLQK